MAIITAYKFNSSEKTSLYNNPDSSTNLWKTAFPKNKEITVK